MSDKTLYARCLDDCLFPVYSQEKIDDLLAERAPLEHTHDDRYYTEEETDALLNTVKRYFVDVTATIEGWYAPTYSCNMTLEELQLKPGIPWLRYFVTVDGVESEYPTLCCELIRWDAERYVFASGVDAAGVSHQFEISAEGIAVTTFDAAEEFLPASVISDETAQQPVSAWAVQNYAQPYDLTITGTANYNGGTVTLDGTVTAEDFELAYAAGKNIKLKLTFEDVNNLTMLVPLVDVIGTYLDFAAIIDISPYAAGTYRLVAIRIVRASLTASTVNFKKLSLADT